MEEYFEKEYGKGHLESVVKDNDMESLYGLMQEYLDHSLKVELNCEICKLKINSGICGKCASDIAAGF
jgi:hypothetical protein